MLCPVEHYFSRLSVIYSSENVIDPHNLPDFAAAETKLLRNSKRGTIENHSTCIVGLHWKLVFDI